MLGLVAGAGGREKAQEESRSLRYTDSLMDMLTASVLCKLALSMVLSLDNLKSEGSQGFAVGSCAVVASFFCHFSAVYLTWNSINSYLLRRYWDDSFSDVFLFFANSLLLGLLGVSDAPTFLLILASSRFIIIVALLCNLQGVAGGTGGQYAFMRSGQLFLAGLGYLALHAMTPCTELHIYPFFFLLWVLTLFVDNVSLKAHCLALQASNLDLLPQKRERHISLVVCTLGYLLLCCFTSFSFPSSERMPSLTNTILALCQLTVIYQCYFTVYDGAGEACLIHATDSESRLRGFLWTMSHFPLVLGLALISPIMSINIVLSTDVCVAALGFGNTIVLSSVWLMRLTHTFPPYDSQIGSESEGLGSSSSDFVGYGAISAENNRSQAEGEGYTVFLRVMITTGARSCFHLFSAPIIGLLTFYMASNTNSGGESKSIFRAFATSIILQCVVLLFEYCAFLAGRRLASMATYGEEDVEKGALTDENLKKLTASVGSQESSPSALNLLRITPQRSSSSLTSGNGGGIATGRTSLLFTVHTPEAKAGDVKRDLVISPSLAAPSNSRLNTKY